MLFSAHPSKRGTTLAELSLLDSRRVQGVGKRCPLLLLLTKGKMRDESQGRSSKALHLKEVVIHGHVKGRERVGDEEPSPEEGVTAVSVQVHATSVMTSSEMNKNNSSVRATKSSKSTEEDSSARIVVVKNRKKRRPIQEELASTGKTITKDLPSKCSVTAWSGLVSMKCAILIRAR
ncbi:hypothetical protein Tco_1183157 [Tanacetum coccineum]